MRLPLQAAILIAFACGCSTIQPRSALHQDGPLGTIRGQSVDVESSRREIHPAKHAAASFQASYRSEASTRKGFDPPRRGQQIVPQAEAGDVHRARCNVPSDCNEAVPFLLKDAIDLALSNSPVIRVLSGRSVIVSPSTVYDPEILAQRWKAARAIFDPQMTAGYLGSKIDRPPQSFFGPGIPANVKRNEATFTGGVAKKWEMGGTTNVSFAPPLAYLFYPDDPRNESNPIWSADLIFELQQPLLRGAGIAANTAPVRIAQLKSDQSSWDVKRNLISELRSVEEAYWTLQAALAVLQSVDAIFPLLDEAVRIEELRFRSNLVTRSEVARTRLQRSQFVQQRVRAEANVRERELRLRQLIGLPNSDGRFLLPVNPPIRHEPQENAREAVDLALQNRPDLIQQRLNVQVRELELTVAKNGQLPQLDFRLLNRTSGLGSRFSDALDQMDTFKYQNWTGGMTFGMPIGNRAPRATARAAEIQLARERALLRQNMQNAEFEIADVLRELWSSWSQYDFARAQVEDSREWVDVSRIRFEHPPADDAGQNWTLIALNDYQNALKAHIDAIADASRLLATYNTWLARLEETQGTLLENRNVRLEDDPCSTDPDMLASWNPTDGLQPSASMGKKLDIGWSDDTEVAPVSIHARADGVEDIRSTQSPIPGAFDHHSGSTIRRVESPRRADRPPQGGRWQPSH